MIKTAAKFLIPAVQSAKNALLGLVYPRACYGCESNLEEDDNYLCSDCRKQLHPIRRPLCEVCGQAYSGELTPPFQCSNCSDRILQFDFARAGYQSKGLARVLVHRFKYNGHFFLSGLLGEMLAATLQDPRLADVGSGEDEDDEWVLVPVPLHPKRLREREFNQADELCRQLTRSHGLKTVNALRRTRYTRRQAMLDRSERLKNLRGAFVISPRIRQRKEIHGRRVLLVDDVLTTGATASECAQVLSEAGALKVVVITAVRG